MLLSMQPVILCFIFIVNYWYFSAVVGQELRIVLLLYPSQSSEVKIFEDGLLAANRNNKHVTFHRIPLAENDNDLEKICHGISNGLTLLIDFTWSGNEMAIEITNNLSMPYVHIDMSLAPYLAFLDAYLDSRDSRDVLIIIDQAKYVDESYYYWLNSLRLKNIIPEVVDRKVANNIKLIRPIPSSFAIIATTENMKRLYNDALKQDLVRLSDRWNFVFTDFKSEQFDRSTLKNRSISLLFLNQEICCELVVVDKQQRQRPDNCQCSTDNFQLNEYFLKRLSFEFDKLLQSIIAKNLVSVKENIRCNNIDDKFPEEIKEKFDELLESIVKENSKILNKIDSTIRVKVQGEIEKLNEQLAHYQNGVIVKIKDKKIKPVKPFYRVGITYALPWSYKVKNPKTGKYYWTGYCADLTQKISEILNFDYEFVEPTDGGTFGEKINGVWNGVVGGLAYGDTDMALTALIMTADREEVIDFVAPYYESTGISIVMRNPVRRTSLFKFMTVLKLEVWLSIVAAVLVTGVVVWFLDKYSPYSARNDKDAYPYPCREFTLKESFWFALTSFTPQGGGEAPKSLSGRTVVIAYWLFVVLMLATFTANLAAFLTVERMQTPVQSLEQLARQSRIRYTVVKDSDVHQHFINMKFAEDTLYRMWKEVTLNASTDDIRYRVWDYPIREQWGHILLAINDSDPVANVSEGFRRVNEHLDADFAFIHDSSEIKYEISKNCNFTEVGEVFAEKPIGIAVQQGSHLQDDLSRTILDLLKERFFDHLQRKYWNNSVKGYCSDSDENEGITLDSLGGVFIATLVGLAIAMITLLFEVVFYRGKDKKQKEQKNKIAKIVHHFKPHKIHNISSTVDLNNKMLTMGKPLKPPQAIKVMGKNENVEYESTFPQHSLYPKARNRITRIN